ncbi:probable galacturonosyltransferase 5 isoform X3 [Durio zibethinus]|uniref:Hexosyltransferase n=1 Tax=Durio zibethinus TaxID=66656 RepID=A0A6P6A0T7_DURZI|nr:probable galacturonosyltransferase 5 isoform X3 [Durio zibethinus]
MKKHRRWQRILILSLLSFSVFAPIVLVSPRLKTLTFIGRNDFMDDLASINYMSEDLRLNAIEQEAAKELKGPKLVVLKEKNFSSVVSHSSDENRNVDQSGDAQDASKSLEANDSETNYKGKDKHQIQQNIIQMNSREKEQSNQGTGRHDPRLRSQSRRVTDAKVKQMRDQLIRAKAYLSFAPPGSNSHLVKELRTRIKEVERAVGEASKDSDLSRSASQRMRSMEVSLAKANYVFPDCSAMAAKLRAMAYNIEEQVHAQKNQESYLIQLAGRTTPKSLHCLSMRLTAEYFFLQPEERQLPHQKNLNDPDLYHYAVFSDNVLACAVVVKSTISSAKGLKRSFWKAGSLPLGWITFYNQTVALEKRWHALGLGHNSGLGQGDIENAAVIHYDGVMKPWLEIGIAKYKSYWSKHVQYDHPYLQRCNIHE